MSTTVTSSPPRGRIASHRRGSGEMAEQLTGVLGEVLATADGVRRPAFSSLFSPEVQAIDTELVWEDGPTRLRQGGSTPPDSPGGPPDHGGPARPPVPPGEIVAGLPLPQVEQSDPAAGHLATFAGLNPAQRVLALTLAAAGDPTIPREVTGDDLRQAGGQLGRLAVDGVRRQQLTAEVLRAALDWCASGQPAAGGPILGCEPNARAVRFGLERSYRALARLTPDEARRVELADMANAIRPRTLT
jgi:Protein kinase G tetratricopeptide repeat